MKACQFKGFRINTENHIIGGMSCTRGPAALLLLLLGMLGGCESIALMPRPDVDRPYGDTSEPDRRSRSGELRGDTVSRDRSIAPDQNEVVGTVERVDTVNREIHVRTPEARVVVVKYEQGLLVQSRDRDMPVDSLRRGDLILVQVSRTPRGERYADLIRINDRQDMGSRSY